MARVPACNQKTLEQRGYGDSTFDLLSVLKDTYVVFVSSILHMILKSNCFMYYVRFGLKAKAIYPTHFILIFRNNSHLMYLPGLCHCFYFFLGMPKSLSAIFNTLYASFSLSMLAMCNDDAI